LAIGLVEFSESFRYPSEVHKIDWTTGKSSPIFRDRRYAITDVWFAKDGTAYLAGVQVTGEVRSVAPGKVKVFQSKDLTNWKQMEVDYRAEANRVSFAAIDEHDMWLATDNGMILKLQ
jgi:hypothetical protein